MTRRVLRVAFAVPLLAIGLGTASAAARVGPAMPLCAQAASTYHAGIVVEHGDGQVLRQCVGFNTATITALAVLQASGIENATQTYGGLGDAVCQIDHEPATYTACLPSSGSYWVFFISRGGGAWTSSSQGISNATVANGDDVGFRYDPLGGANPPPVSPAGTCVTSTPTPTARPTPSPTPRPTAVATTAPGGTANPAAPSHATSSAAPVASSEAAPMATEGPKAASGGIAQSSSPSSASPNSHVATAAAIAGPFVPGIALAACVVGALLALLGIQGIRRHQR